VSAARAGKVPARLSRDAGRYLCNYTYWRALRRAPQGRPLVQFIHIPAVPVKPRPRRRIKRRSASLVQLVKAAENVLIALATATRH
jgi:pyroglutamyl-peptidase